MWIVEMDDCIKHNCCHCRCSATRNRTFQHCQEAETVFAWLIVWQTTATSNITGFYHWSCICGSQLPAQQTLEVITIIIINIIKLAWIIQLLLGPHRYHRSRIRYLSKKKFANFNEFSKIKKFVQKFVKRLNPEVILNWTIHFKLKSKCLWYVQFLFFML